MECSTVVVVNIGKLKHLDKLEELSQIIMLHEMYRNELDKKDQIF